MTETQKDYERIQHDTWYAKSVGCPAQSIYYRYDRVSDKYYAVGKECLTTGKQCAYEQCVFAHWGMV